MKANILLSITGVVSMAAVMLTSAGCQTLCAATSVTRATKAPGVWVIQNDTVQVTVDAPRGRIMHYGFRDQPNVLWNNYQAEESQYMIGAWVNWGGDKIWPWPQGIFGWPPPEVSYEVRANDKGDGVVMTSAVIPLIRARVIRTIELDDDSSSMVVTSWFEPTETNFGKPMSAWSVTQIPPPDSLYVRIALAGDRNRYINRKLEGNDTFHAKQVGQRVVKLATPDTVSKTFLDAEVIAAVYPDYILLQRQLPAHTQGVWAADQRAQIYSHGQSAANVPRGKSYYELEWTAPILPPNQVHNAPLRVVYKLVKLNKNTTQEQIVELIDKLP